MDGRGAEFMPALLAFTVDRSVEISGSLQLRHLGILHSLEVFDNLLLRHVAVDADLDALALTHLRQFLHVVLRQTQVSAYRPPLDFQWLSRTQKYSIGQFLGHIIRQLGIQRERLDGRPSVTWTDGRNQGVDGKYWRNGGR